MKKGSYLWVAAATILFIIITLTAGINLSQDYTREELMQIAISSGVDGIIVTADESDEMTGLINKAEEKQIPESFSTGKNKLHLYTGQFSGVYCQYYTAFGN